VIGPVGCGKSSLLLSLFNEVQKLNGKICVGGKLAFVPQQAWLKNASLRDNILFGLPLQNDLYNRVIVDCALSDDVALLPAQHDTEIGEKGVNLSGGQRQRISLARAVYSQADIVILDDPLSAVDGHVARHLFERVIGPRGCLRNSTRLIATNTIGCLAECDRILFLGRDGKQLLYDSYKSLCKNSAFIEYIGGILIESQDPWQATEQRQKSTDKLRKESNEIGKIIKNEKVQTGNVSSYLIYLIKRQSNYF